MGLIKAGLSALGTTLADQWKEFFYCDAIDNGILVVKGQKSVGGKSSNTKGNDNVISNGSGIAVADGQCMMIVEQGKVVEVCAEPGQFTYDNSVAPSIFAGSLGQSIIDTFKTIGKRFTMGGDAGLDQRVYYFNTKEIVDNKFGTQNPIPFRVVDRNIGLDLDTAVRCNGIYSYRIANPILFYTNVCGNVAYEYAKSELEAQLKTEFVDALQPSFSRLSALEIRPNALPGHTGELKDAVNDALAKKWGELRGIEVVSIALNPPTVPDEDMDIIKTAQRNAINRDPGMAAATLVGAQAGAMENAAKNDAGAMTGFMGMGMAMNAGGGNAQNLFAMAQQNKENEPKDAWKCACGNIAEGNFCSACGAKKAAGMNTWKCKCGAENSGKFCSQCGERKPEDGWKCACGAVCQGNFCTSCGAKKPVSYRCSKCGYEPADRENPPKFCPECGDAFDAGDMK